jgi:hypothetical protein
MWVGAMLLCMRTTVDLDDFLLREAKLVARQNGVTLTSFIEDALRERLSRRRAVQKGKGEWVSLPTFKGEGLQPGVDLDDSRALLDIMDGIA